MSIVTLPIIITIQKTNIIYAYYWAGNPGCWKIDSNISFSDIESPVSLCEILELKEKNTKQKLEYEIDLNHENNKEKSEYEVDLKSSNELNLKPQKKYERKLEDEVADTACECIVQ